MNKYLFLTIIFCSGLFKAQSQETYIPFGSDEYHLLDRMETRSGSLSNQLFLNTQPVSRKSEVQFLFDKKTDFYNSGLSNVDFYNINRAISLSGEWTEPNGDGAIDSKKPFLNTFYKKEADFIYHNRNGFFLVANPVIGFDAYHENKKQNNTLINAVGGAEIRGQISNYASFYFNGTYNYDEPINYVNDWINKYDAVPGAGSFTRTANGKGYKYWLFRGYVDAPLIKDHISLTLGYDQHFIGDGYRSLFLSDFSNGAAFARINTKIWKFNYQNLYMMLGPQSSYPGQTAEQGHKYATAHYLSLNATRWLNLGFFEMVTFTRDGRYDFGYLNPIIFYRSIERSLGSPDKVSIGFSAKAIVAKHLNFYTQILINEFTSKELFSGKGYWANKWGIQFGAKYFDAFGISNLDLQAETNIVRPYTFQHYVALDSSGIANNTNYNEPLAHPLGAGFAEFIGMINYQPAPRVSIHAKAMYYMQGIDTAGSNNGSNILLDYSSRSSDYGIDLINGPQGKCTSVNVYVSYELKPRMYLELGGVYRKYTVEDQILPMQRTFFFNAGLRINLARRDYAQF